MTSTQNQTNASEIFAIVQHVSSQITKDRIQEILNKAKDLNIEESHSVVNLLDLALEKHHHLLKKADRVLLLLTKIASSANIVSRTRTINSEFITSDSRQSPDVYRIIGQSDIRVKVVKRGKKGTAEVFSEGFVTWTHLSHPNILPIYGALLEGKDNPVSLVSLQAKEGNIVDHAKTLPQAARMPLISDVIEGLCYLHNLNVVHGDLNPENVLIGHDGRALITGLDGSQDSYLTSVRYSAPEVLDDDDVHSTTASDVWSLGCIIYEVLSGKVPFFQIRQEGKVGVAIAAGKKPVRPSQGVSGMEEISDTAWNPVLPCWEFEAKDRPSCLQFQVLSSTVFHDGHPATQPLIQPEAFAPNNNSGRNSDFELASSILMRIVGSDLSISTPSKIPEHLQKPLSGLADTLTRAEIVAAAAKKLSPDDTQLLVDIADLLIMESPITTYHRNPAFALLTKVMISTHIFPQRYNIKRIRYDSTPIVDDDSVKVYKGRDLNVCINMILRPSDISEILEHLAFSACWSHPNFLPLYGIFHEVSNEIPRFCLVSPYMKNGLLRDYAPRLPQKERLVLVSDVISALVFLQSLFLGHGSLRGDSVLISDQGRAVIDTSGDMDRGILSSYANTWPTHAPEMYALRFRPPERVRAGEYLPSEAGVWSLGCLVYEVLSRKAPYHQYTEASEIRSALSEGETLLRPVATEDDIDQIDNELWDLIMGCCAYKPESRLTLLEIQTLLEEMDVPDNRTEATSLPDIQSLFLRPPNVNWDGVKGLLSQVQVEILRNPLSKLIQNHTKDVAEAVTQLSAEDTRIFMDFLDLALNNHITISNERNRVLALLSRITTSTHIFPHRYELKEIKYDPFPIAGGGFGTVHRGTSDPNICVKVITKVDSADLMDVVKELIMWAHSSHPNVLPFYGVFIDEYKHLCLVSPFMSRGNLHNYAPRLAQKNRIPLLFDVIKGLSYLHGLGVVHTDLKGENVLISDEGHGLITDFGASHVTTATGGVTTTSVLSTLRFTAPEIVLNRHLRPTQECDIWSFGCLCYEVLSRKLPYFEYTLEAQVLAALSRKQPPTRPSSTGDSGDEDEDWYEIDEQDWDEIDGPAWSLIERCCTPKPEGRPNASQVEEFIVDLKIWDDRPKAKDHPGADILRRGSNPDVDLNRIGELLNQLLVRFLARSLLHYSIKDLVSAIMELELVDEDVTALIEFWDLVVQYHLVIFKENNHCLDVLAALICSTQKFPYRYFLEMVIEYNRVAIGSGSFGKVHQGSDPMFCIKETDGGDFNATALSDPCINAVAASVYLSHPNILPFYGIGMGRGSPVLISPFMRNGNLNNYVLDLPQKSRILLISDIIEAMTYLHFRGIVHGNLKGENVLVSDEGRALVTDFKPYHVNVAAAEGGPTGPYVTSTLRFTAPESVKDSQMLPTSKSDIWSIGCLIYLVFSRKVPFDQYSEDAEIRAVLSRGELPARPISADDGTEEINDIFWDFIAKCCKPEPEDRPALGDIKKWISNLGVEDDRPPATPFPGAEILKYRQSHPGINTEKIQNILTQIKFQLSPVEQDEKREDEA